MLWALRRASAYFLLDNWKVFFCDSIHKSNTNKLFTIPVRHAEETAPESVPAARSLNPVGVVQSRISRRHWLLSIKRSADFIPCYGSEPAFRKPSAENNIFETGWQVRVAGGPQRQRERSMRAVVAQRAAPSAAVRAALSHRPVNQS